MSAEDLDAVAVGDEVRVSHGGRGVEVGTVVKIGRTLVHIREHSQVTTYYRHNRQRRDGYSGGFRTLARVADDDLRAATVKRLRERGIEFSFGRGRDWSTAQLVALAEAVERIKGAAA